MEVYDKNKIYKVGDKFKGDDGIVREVIKSEPQHFFKCAHCEAEQRGCTWRVNTKNGLKYSICSIKKV